MKKGLFVLVIVAILLSGCTQTRTGISVHVESQLDPLTKMQVEYRYEN